MCQYPNLTSINPSSRDLSPPLLCSYLTQANLLLPFLRHRSINLFLLAYQRIWIETEEYSFEEKLVQDLAVSTCVAPPVPCCWYPCAVGSRASPLKYHFPLLVSLLKGIESVPISPCTAGSVIHTMFLASMTSPPMSEPADVFEHCVPSNIGKRASCRDASTYQ